MNVCTLFNNGNDVIKKSKLQVEQGGIASCFNVQFWTFYGVILVVNWEYGQRQTVRDLLFFLQKHQTGMREGYKTRRTNSTARFASLRHISLLMVSFTMKTMDIRCNWSRERQLRFDIYNKSLRILIIKYPKFDHLDRTAFNRIYTVLLRTSCFNLSTKWRNWEAMDSRELVDRKLYRGALPWR